MAMPSTRPSPPHLSPRTVRVLSVFCQAGSLCVALAGCAGDVGKAYRIDTAHQPAYQDDNVRFQTTYYFRVFDTCQVPHDARPSNEYGAHAGDETFKGRKEGRYEIVNDQLYRFRMIGKASAVFSNVHFESGTLRAEEIDPFGASVEYDEARKRFTVRSAQETRAQQRQDAVIADIRKLTELRSLLKGVDEVEKTIDGLIEEQLSLMKRAGRDGGLQSSLVSPGDVGQTARDEESHALSVLTEKLKTLRDFLAGEDKSKAAEKILGEIAKLPSNGDSLKGKKDAVTKAIEAVLGIIGGDITNALQQAQEATKLAAMLMDEKKKESDTAEQAFKQSQQNTIAKQKELDAERAKEQPDKTKVINLERELRELQDAQKDKEEKLAEARQQRKAAIALRESILAQENVLATQLRRVNQSSEWSDKGVHTLARGTDRPSSAKCSDGKMARRGFQIVGPEGVRDFDQDERLIMAMTVDAQPLIDLLKKASSRRLKGGEQAYPSLLPLVQERARLAVTAKELGRMELELASPADGTASKLSVEEMVNRLVQELERDSGKETAVKEKALELFKSYEGK